jgi:hypothetical protein
MATRRKIPSMYASWPKPDFKSTVKTNKSFRARYQAAILYAHYELSSSDLKKEVIKYLKTLDPRHPLLERIRDMNDQRFATIGKYMYILNHGGDVLDEVMDRMMPALESIVTEEEFRVIEAAKEQIILDEKLGRNRPVTQSAEVVISTVTIQDRLRDRAREVAGEIEGWIDEFCVSKKSAEPKKVEEFVNLFKANELKAPHMRHMTSIFENRITEVAAAAEGKDKLISEGYSNFTKSELKKFDLFHKNLMSACAMMQEVAKAVRLPRKKKPVSQEKLVDKMKYKKEDSSLGIVSQSPISIIGSKEVWCFDTKTRKLTKYVADDVTGPLSVKGSSIIFLNETKSVCKTLRKPAEQLAAFKQCNKVQLRTFMEGITTVGVSPTGKINENCIILKIV